MNTCMKNLNIRFHIQLDLRYIINYIQAQESISEPRKKTQKQKQGEEKWEAQTQRQRWKERKVNLKLFI